jgi:hypothetical protein
MADAMQGIMGLPQAPTGQDPAAEETINPEFFSPAIESYARNNPVQFGNDMLDSMAQTSPELVEAFRARLAQLKVPPEVIEALGQMVDVIMASPENYAEIRERLIEEDDVPEELLPETLDLAYFGALNIALDQLAAMQQPAPIRMANGGIATLNPIALELARMGRNGDRMLAHITPSEARLLRMRGGSGTINPETGLPEFFLKKLFKGIGNALKSVGKAIGDLVKDIASSTVGKIILTAAAVYFMGPAGLNLAGTAGSITGLTGAVAVGVNTFAASTLVNLASGQSLGQSLKGGALAGITAGFGSSIFGLPSGYEGGAPTTPAPVVDRSFPSGGTPPGSVPGAGTSGVTSAVSDPSGQIVSRSLDTTAGAATPSSVARTAADVVTPQDVAANARTLAAQPQSAVVNAPVDASAVTQAAGRTPLFTPEHYAKYPNATFLRPEGGINVDALSGAPSGGGININAPTGTGIQIPGVTPTPTVQQVGIEALTPSNLSPAARTALADPAAATTRSLIANTGQAATQTTPGVWESLKQGNFTDAAKAAWNNISPSEIQKQGALTAEKAGMDAMTAMRARLPSATPEMLNTAYQTAYKAALPGIVSTYGPMALTGLGVMGAMGGFKKEQPEPPPGFSGPTGVDLLKSNPETYGLSYGGTRSSYALNPYDYMYLPPLKIATGGIASLDRYAHGGQPSHFPRKTGPINGPGTGTSDSIPAMLSDGEFVFTAKAVRGAGGGSRRAGAKKMYALMKALERKA